MKKDNSFPTPELHRRYRQLASQLAGIGLLSQGSVQDRTGRQGGGAGYQWTRKVADKTVTVALTQEQYRRMKEAVANKREVMRIIDAMEKLSRQVIFETAPHEHRRKRLSKKVLGLI